MLQVPSWRVMNVCVKQGPGEQTTYVREIRWQKLGSVVDNKPTIKWGYYRTRESMPESRFKQLYAFEDWKSVIHFISRTLLEVVSCAVFSRPEIRGSCPCASKFTPTGVLFLYFWSAQWSFILSRSVCPVSLTNAPLHFEQVMTWTKEDVSHVNFFPDLLQPIVCLELGGVLRNRAGQASAVEALVSADGSILCFGVVLRPIDQNGMLVNGLQEHVIKEDPESRLFSVSHSSRLSHISKLNCLKWCVLRTSGPQGVTYPLTTWPWHAGVH